MELVRWLETFEGSVFDKRVEIQETQFGKGLVAIEDIPGSSFFTQKNDCWFIIDLHFLAGTILLQIPRDAILTVSHAINDEKIARMLENIELVLNGCEVLAIYHYLK